MSLFLCANENQDKSRYIKPECAKFYGKFLRYEFQCEKGGTTIKVLPAISEKNDLEEYLFIFLKRVSNDQYIHMLNANDKTWVNGNDIVEELPFPDITRRRNQCKFDSELRLINA